MVFFYIGHIPSCKVKQLSATSDDLLHSVPEVSKKEDQVRSAGFSSSLVPDGDCPSGPGGKLTLVNILQCLVLNTRGRQFHGLNND